jgi:hypothetical protein
MIGGTQWFTWWDAARDEARRRAALTGRRHKVTAKGSGGRAWAVVPTTGTCQPIRGGK